MSSLVNETPIINASIIPDLPRTRTNSSASRAESINLKTKKNKKTLGFQNPQEPIKPETNLKSMNYKYINCSEALIFLSLSLSKTFYEKSWTVNIDLSKDKGIIKLSSASPVQLEKLYKRVLSMINSLIKISITYQDTDHEELTKLIKYFANKNKNVHLAIIYTDDIEGKEYKIGLTAYNANQTRDLELLKKEIDGWNFSSYSSNYAFLLILNYKPNLELLIKMHLSNILDVHESKLKFFTIEEIVLVLRYNPKLSKI
jgi:hypothetical protein